MADAPDLVRPRYLSIPDFDRTLGPEVGAVATLAGFPPDPEQQMLLDAAFAVDKHGKSVAFMVVVIAPRQNLKTGFFKQVALGQLFVRDERLVVWSAHEFDTAQEALNDVESLVDGSDVLRKRVKLTERGNVASRGAVPEIRLTSGARLKFKTRTSGGGRGLSGRKVFLDEGYALQTGQVGALMPIMLAQPDPQVYVGSSACRPESAVLWDYVQAGRAGNDPRMVYAEWCAPDAEEICGQGAKCDHGRSTPGCACDKPELLLPVHSAITRGRILIQTVMDLRNSMPPDEYGREVMGWHDRPAIEARPIRLEEWADLAVQLEDRPAGAPCFLLDSSPGLVSSSITVAALNDGVPHLEIADYRSAASWLPGRAAELKERWPEARFAVFGHGPVMALLPDLAQNGIEPEQFTTADEGRACAHLQKLVADKALTHSGEEPFTAALAGAIRRDIGDGLWGWSRRRSADISPIVGATGALWLLETTKTDGAVEPWVMYG